MSMRRQYIQPRPMQDIRLILFAYMGGWPACDFGLKFKERLLLPSVHHIGALSKPWGRKLSNGTGESVESWHLMPALSLFRTNRSNIHKIVTRLSEAPTQFWSLVRTPFRSLVRNNISFPPPIIISTSIRSSWTSTASSRSRYTVLSDKWYLLPTVPKEPHPSTSSWAPAFSVSILIKLALS